MAPKLKPRGNPTNQLFAHWIFLGTPCRPKGATWRENGAPSEPKLIKQSTKNKAVECYSLHLATARQTHPRRSLSVFVNSRFRQLPSEVNSR